VVIPECHEKVRAAIKKTLEVSSSSSKSSSSSCSSSGSSSSSSGGTKPMLFL